MRDEYDIEIERDVSGAAARLVFRRSPVDTVATVSVPCGRPSCGEVVAPQKFKRGERKVYCSAACRTKRWDELHPRVGPRQAALDLTPAPAPLPPVQDQRVPKREMRRLSEASMRIEVALRLEGPISNRGLALMFPPGSAWRTRLSDVRLWLQKQGETVASYDCGGGLWWYWIAEAVR